MSASSAAAKPIGLPQAIRCMAKRKADREGFKKIIAYLSARHRQQTAALIDILTSFITSEQRASALEQWELKCSQKGWAFRSPIEDEQRRADEEDAE